MVRQSPTTVVEFRFFKREASQVFLVGDFNGWDSSAMPMNRTTDGLWTIKLRLEPGAYQFKYLADGQWFLDYAAFGLEQGPYGWNSVVVVKRTPRPRTAQPAIAPAALPVILPAPTIREPATAGFAVHP